jgi:L-ribulose-5-phosphate 4-epimerase
MKYREIRALVFSMVAKAQAAGLIRLSAGNISTRTEDGLVAITPSGIRYDVLRAEDIAIVDLDGRPVDAPRKPSSELPMHLAILRELPEVGAIFHTHSPFAISFAILGREVPLVNLELLTCGGPLPVAPWACPGTPEAGKVTIDIFRRRPELKICLLRNHGLVAIGRDVENAYEIAYDAEVGMQTYYQALQVGKPEPLTPDQIDQIHRVYR